MGNFTNVGALFSNVKTSGIFPSTRAKQRAAPTLIYDPTPFNGGSKIAAKRVLATLQDTTNNGASMRQNDDALVAITLDSACWQGSAKTHRLWLPQWLIRARSGKTYYLKQCALLLQLLVFRLRYIRAQKLLALSGPGVDAAAIIMCWLTGLTSILMIQGPVAHSRLNAWCLALAGKVFYLAASRNDINALLRRHNPQTAARIYSTMTAFENGLCAHEWPTPTIRQNCHVFWAASLLKWKGLDILRAALAHKDIDPRITATICYIAPQQTDITASEQPTPTHNTFVWREPKHLDTLRSQCGVFVSTSDNEPFGLSVLESMAAGLCPVIPADGAFWHRRLQAGHNCITYSPNDANALARKLSLLAKYPFVIAWMGNNAAQEAKQFTAKQAYAGIVDALME